jgi:hypothetical protein
MNERDIEIQNPLLLHWDEKNFKNVKYLKECLEVLKEVPQWNMANGFKGCGKSYNKRIKEVSRRIRFLTGKIKEKDFTNNEKAEKYFGTFNNFMNSIRRLKNKFPKSYDKVKNGVSFEDYIKIYKNRNNKGK